MSKWSSLIILLLVATVFKIAAGADETTTEFYLVYKMNQEVDGNGFFSSFQDVTAGHLNLVSRAHGSGSYRGDALVKSRAECDEDTGRAYESTDSNITYIQSADYAYSPRSFRFGKSFILGNFDSRGAEKVCLRNYGSNVSISSLFDSLDSISKDISLSLAWTDLEDDDSATPYSAFSYSDEKTSKTKFNLDAAFTGRGHIRVQELNRVPQEAKTLVDEDYFGTYSISKRISHDFYYLDKREGDTWLPCCYGGWNDMLYYDQKGFGKNAGGVFDCTCYKGN
ncbi:MAG: hypothetical protein HPY61_06070 [Methanotrichaceae archaeon]|nr:hypothetical protein [Methanotrichaceae archaeon]